MNRFLPRRRLQFTEIVLIPEALYHLSMAWTKVRFKSSKSYLPAFQVDNEHVLSAFKIEKATQLSIVINGLSTRTIWTSTCLIKVMALHKMLQRRGIDHQLHFGVAQTENNKLEAHAWLSVDGKVLVGGENMHTFTEIGNK
jgi:hypothetical protein